MRKILDNINEEADQSSRDRDHAAVTKYTSDPKTQLQEKLAEQGRSLTQMQQSFRQTFLAEVICTQAARQDQGRVA